ncbi:SLIT-ROBO Rho GTPase-activating protein 1-like isoform X3 [Eriocheir sinensis]|uniref:SLIT-ROBO Rho GTPase-activating protein 1-like isoform X3 n=1 Tax=Eriocheir sinensis TaxID=95602 RepID=UPI0021C7927C|nr:SLIT-ROBO Rho GTPase-activating protein 1-like isoform X3 [Eriocheir sinensis]
MSTGNLSVVGAPPGPGTPGALAKLSGLHEWLSLENRRVKQWWSTRSGTDLHKIYLNHLQDTDELRSQLNEQLRALDGRVDTQTALVGELQDWFRRRAELHQDYSFKLDKLAKSLQARHKEQKYKREQLHLLSVYSCWNSLVNQTRKDARDHAAMADVYLNNIIPRFTQVQDDVQRIYKRCREIGYDSHEELLKVLHELHTTMRTYHTYQTEYKNAETKLRNFEAQRSKLEQVIPKEKLEKNKKFRLIEKEIQKRSNKHMDAKLKALKARNEYILSMDSANAAIHKYFVEDLSDIVDCMDFGFHSSIARALLTHVSGQECLRRSLQSGIDDINKTINNLDSRLDKQRFLEFNNAAFMLPKKFEFQGHKGDETHESSTTTQVNQVVVNRHVQEEMEKRYAHLVSRLTSLKTESEETWKTIETAEKTLMEMINQRDYDCAHYFVDEPRPDNKQPESMLIKMKADRQETEDFYLSKFREYTLGSNLITRLQARYELMRKALGDETQASSSPTPTRNLVNKPRRRRIGRNPLMGQPKLFGGSLEEYLEVSGQEIPLIMKSCIRVINLYGLHHQGIFRVSGSQVEINNFRESFERMEDPLADVTDASDINSVAGVLKLYLRELREPLFPTVFFDQFMEIAPLEKKHDFVVKMRDVVTSLPRPVFVVMRYLFAFLNHLSEFSDENMMDPYNLAICFGPTLVPIPEDKDQVQYQNLVNELIKNIIIFSEDIFPGDGGHVYEKYISRDSIDLEVEVGDAPSEAPDDVDSEPGQSEDESEILEAIAQFDFLARSERELSFNKGDVLVLHSQVSSDWWRGSFQGKQGLIPDKYILLKIRDEDKDRLSDRGAADQLRRRASSSSESILSSSTQQSSEGVIKPTSQNGATQAPLSPSPASMQSQDSCASPVSRDDLGGASSSLGLDSGGVSDGAQADGGRSTSPLPSTPGQASHSPTPPHSLQHGACLSLSDVSSIVSVQEEERQFVSSECSLQVSMPGEGGGQPSSSPSSPQPSRHPSCPLLEPVTQSVAPALVAETNEEAQMEESPKGKNLEQLSSSMISSSTSGDSATRGPLSQSMLEVHDDAGDRGVGGQWELRPRCPSQSSNLSSSSSEERLNHSSPSPRTFWERRAKLKPAAGAPDLVMDLPVTPLSSSPKEQGGISPRIRRPHLHRESQSYDSSSSSGGSSPRTQSPDMTPGEVFAKQNLNTLKKTPALKTFGSHSTDAQTQTFLAHKLTSSLSLSQRSTESTELRITEAEEPTSVSTIVRTRDPPMQSIDSEGRSERKVSSDVRVEIRSASDRPPEGPAPSTPKLRYLEAVALSTGGAPSVLKPPVRVKPSVLKKPSLTRGSPEPEQSK